MTLMEEDNGHGYREGCRNRDGKFFFLTFSDDQIFIGELDG